MILTYVAGRVYLFANSFQNSLLVDKLSFCCLILFLLIHNVNRSKSVTEKMAWAIPSIWICGVMVWNSIIKLSPDYNIIDRVYSWGAFYYRCPSFNDSISSGLAWMLFTPVLIFIGCLILSKTSKVLNIPSDSFNENNIYILLATPSNKFRDLVWCAFTSLPITSVWALSKGYNEDGKSKIYTYYFKKLGFMKGVLRRREVINGKIPLRNYIRLDTGIGASQKQNELKKRVGTPWSLRNALCYFIFLNSIGGKSIFKMIKERI